MKTLPKLWHVRSPCCKELPDGSGAGLLQKSRTPRTVRQTLLRAFPSRYVPGPWIGWRSRESRTQKYSQSYFLPPCLGPSCWIRRSYRIIFVTLVTKLPTKVVVEPRSSKWVDLECRTKCRTKRHGLVSILQECSIQRWKSDRPYRASRLSWKWQEASSYSRKARCNLPVICKSRQDSG